MECKRVEQATIKDCTPPAPQSNLNPKVYEAIKRGRATVIQEYRGKILVRYEYKDHDGPIVVLAEKLPCVSGKTDKVDFSWHKVVTVYATSEECLSLEMT